MTEQTPHEGTPLTPAEAETVAAALEPAKAAELSAPLPA